MCKDPRIGCSVVCPHFAMPAQKMNIIQDLHLQKDAVSSPYLLRLMGSQPLQKEVPMSIKLLLDTTGKDAVFISNSYRYISGLSTLELFRNPPEKIANPERLKTQADRLQVAYEGGTVGDRGQIAMRNQARKELTDMFNRVCRYLEAIATEEDIPALIQAGFDVRRPWGGRRKPSPAVAT